MAEILISLAVGVVGGIVLTSMMVYVVRVHDRVYKKR